MPQETSITNERTVADESLEIVIVEVEYLAMSARRAILIIYFVKVRNCEILS